ncbi:MAG TPA: HlyD family type I secretion periplasmic adaptor subunit [Phenylobacterium sp.]|jgi:HlyD family type I secretion membrane fusion protein|nr:HlyD family type I secretion periplasmic adaptor subunit [Phenylobacterium sp.]
MKLDLTPVRSSYIVPTFGGDDRLPIDPALRRRMRRPMIAGAAIIVILVLGLGLWASLTPLSTGITAQGEVRVESNKKTLKHQSSGTIRQILVQEGQHVRAGQPMILYDDTEARASNDVLQNQYDSLEAQSARLTAEATGRPAPEFPADLMARMSDPRVAGMIRDQQFLFTTRLQLFQSQNSVLNQRLDQIQSQIEGQQTQVASIDEQIKLTQEEMAGYQELYDKGFAPKPLILARQRSLADLSGHRGSLMSDIARMHQQQGETRMQMAAGRDTRQSQAAETLRDTQAKIADTSPRLTAAKETLDETVIRAPVDGYVFNLTQFTVGGVTNPGETLMEVVPANAPIIVSAQVTLQDIDKVHVGMDAKVRFTGLNQRWHSPLNAKVIMVSPDKIVNDKAAAAFYRADLRIDAKELTKLKKSAQITPGMPAQVTVVSGQKTVMGSLISPITDTIKDALHD